MIIKMLMMMIDYQHILTKKRRLKKNTAYFTHAIPPSTILLAVISTNYLKNAQYVHKCGEFLSFLANKYAPSNHLYSYLD